MPDVTIRRLAGAELDETLYALGAYAFEPSPPLANKSEWLEWTAMREGLAYHALFVDGAPASGAATSAMLQNVRGTLYPAHGLWAVATGPAFRRQGYSRRLLAATMEHAVAQGQVFSTLYPFKESFYERLGYVAFALPRTARFPAAGLAPLSGLDLGGRVDLALLGDDYPTYRAYLARLRERTHGMGLFDHPSPAVVAQDPCWLAVARINGEVAGVMLYVLRGEADSPLVLNASRFYYDSSQARYLLLQWIARHGDQVERAEIRLAPAEQPETWLGDLHLRSETDGRGPMARVLSVAGLGGMQVGPGSFSARVLDQLCPWNQRTWRFLSEGGRLQVTAGGDPDCELAIQGLAALIYGTNDPADFAIRGWGNPGPMLQATMREMFVPISAHLHERF